MNTTENNKIIAEFMGAEILSKNTKYSYIQYPLNVSTTTKGQHKETYKQCLHSKNLEYHSDWNWLMEVVEKIESLENHGFTIYRKTTNINGLPIELANTKKATKIEAVYNAVLAFIEWYNKQ